MLSNVIQVSLITVQILWSARNAHKTVQGALLIQIQTAQNAKHLSIYTCYIVLMFAQQDISQMELYVQNVIAHAKLVNLMPIVALLVITLF